MVNAAAGSPLALQAAFPERSDEVPVARPRLPTADAILPFLRQIDVNQWYSNFGPLNDSFQAALGAHFGGPVVVCCSNATVGLAAALIAQESPRGSLCAMPAWSFAASAHAALMAGLVPWFVDVDATSQQLSAAAMREYLGSAPGKVGAVMPVMPYGLPADLSSWDRFSDETGIPVAVDAAAAFDTVRPTHVPAIVSLHATKVLGTGEGGLVASVDGELMKRVGRVLNFGFLGTREATVIAMNGKLSEYGAAVGLAALADWPTIRADFLRVGRSYRAALGSGQVATLQTGFGSDWVASTCMVGLAHGTAEQMADRLAAAGVATRRWWGGGLHRHEAFADFPRLALPVTEHLAATQLGLPCWRDLPDSAIVRICERVAASGR